MDSTLKDSNRAAVLGLKRRQLDGEGFNVVRSRSVLQKRKRMEYKSDKLKFIAPITSLNIHTMGRG